jgi:hypothetical protein
MRKNNTKSANMRGYTKARLRIALIFFENRQVKPQNTPATPPPNYL